MVPPPSAAHFGPRPGTGKKLRPYAVCAGAYNGTCTYNGWKFKPLPADGLCYCGDRFGALVYPENTGQKNGNTKGGKGKGNKGGKGTSKGSSTQPGGSGGKNGGRGSSPTPGQQEKEMGDAAEEAGTGSPMWLMFERWYPNSKRFKVEAQVPLSTALNKEAAIERACTQKLQTIVKQARKHAEALDELKIKAIQAQLELAECSKRVLELKAKVGAEVPAPGHAFPTSAVLDLDKTAEEIMAKQPLLAEMRSKLLIDVKAIEPLQLAIKAYQDKMAEHRDEENKKAANIPVDASEEGVAAAVAPNVPAEPSIASKAKKELEDQKAKQEAWDKWFLQSVQETAERQAKEKAETAAKAMSCG